MLCFRLLDGVFRTLISVKIPTHVGILTFIIMINFIPGCFDILIYKDMLCFRLLDGVCFMFISVKMPTHVGILTFIIMIKFVLVCFKMSI